jgi:ATP-dependent protease ClpP protease subunit
MQSWYQIKAQAPDQDHDSEVLIYDEIGYFGVSASRFISEIQAAGTKRPLVRINSPGGDVFDGLAIANYIASLDATTQVDGLAGSMASVILAAGKRRRMASNAFVMIHDPLSVSYGDADDMRRDADTLDMIAKSLRGMYQRASGQDEETVNGWMKGDVWMDGEAALAAGLVHELTEEISLSASIKAEHVKRFSSAPEVLASVHKTKPKGVKMGLFSRSESLEAFSLKALLATGISEDELRAAQTDGSVEIVNAILGEKIKSAIAPHKVKVEGLSAELTTVNAALETLRASLKAANVDPEKVKDSIEDLASKRMASMAAAAGIDPVPADPAGASEKPGKRDLSHLKGRQKLAALWEKL